MKRFHLNKPKRLIILVVTLVATILTIVLGSILYVGKNVKKGIEYGGGAEYIVNINASQHNNPTKSDIAIAKKISTDVAQSIYERIDGLGVKGATVEPEIKKNGASVRISYPGLTTYSEVKSLEDLIVSKPHLIFTDIYGNVLFDHNMNFRKNILTGDPKGVIGAKPGSVGYKDLVAQSTVPIKNGGAKSTFSQGKYEVQITLKPNKVVSWTEATQYISKLPKGRNQVVAWLDLNKLINYAKTNFPQEWAKSRSYPFAFIHVSEKTGNILKYHEFDAKRYMISAASVKTALSGNTFVIEGNFTPSETKSLAQQISYGISNYKLEIASSTHVGASYGTHAFNKAMIAGLIVFSLIAVFLIINYGLLGALSTISIALYMFLTLLMFTIMRGEYSPETIAALIIGVGMSVDANIITFERLKSEVYRGSSIKKANKLANKQSFSTIFDANITTLIVAFVLFFFGTRSIVGLSVMLILSIFFTLLIMLLFTRMLSTLLINTGIFDERKQWLGVNPKLDNIIQGKINKPDYIKSAKWFSFGSVAIITLAIAMFTGFAVYAGSLTSGLKMSQEFTGGTALSVQSVSKGRMLTSVDVKNINKDLTKTGKVATADIQTIYAAGHSGDAKYITQIKVKTTKHVDTTALIHAYKNSPILKLYSSTTTSDVAKQLVKDAMLAILIAMALIVVYTLIRFKWTYSFSAIVALVHDGLIVTAVFVITRVEISPVFIAGLLSVIGYSINDTIVTFDRVREKMNHAVGELTHKKIKRIANDAIKDTLKRSLLTSFTTVVAVLILMSFGNATKFVFNLALLAGLIAGTYSSIFIATFLWVKLETYRQRKIKVRTNNNFWATSGVEEQTFEGINDFKA